MLDKRLIDANALKVRMFRSKEFNRDTGSFDLPVVPWHDIEDADTIDAVEVVRCRDCKYMRPLEHDGFVACIMWCRAMHGNGFCYEGRKKDAKDMDVLTKDGGAD